MEMEERYKQGTEVSKGGRKSSTESFSDDKGKDNHTYDSLYITDETTKDCKNIDETKDVEFVPDCGKTIKTRGWSIRTLVWLLALLVVITLVSVILSITIYITVQTKMSLGNPKEHAVIQAAEQLHGPRTADNSTSMLNNMNTDLKMIANGIKELRETTNEIENDNSTKTLKQDLKMIEEEVNALKQISSVIRNDTGFSQEKLDTLTEDIEELKLIITDIHNASQSVQDCPGWYLYDQSCYIFVDAQETWTRALTHCQMFGGSLTKVENANEDAFLQNGIQKLTGELGCYFTGGTDVAVEGTWVWYSDQSTISEYTNWHRREPNGNRKENCLTLFKSHQYKWNDVPCTEKCGFICERNK